MLKQLATAALFCALGSTLSAADCTIEYFRGVYYVTKANGDVFATTNKTRAQEYAVKNCFPA